MKRRTLIKLGGLLGIASSAAYAADEVEWLRSVSSKRPTQTEQRYVSGLPSRSEENEGRLLARLLRTPEEAERLLNYDAIPLPYRDQLRTGYDEGFWVVFTTVQDYESSFHPGRWQVRDGVLLYPDVNRLPEPSEREGLFYHYEFHRFILKEPLGSEPEAVAATWKEE
jgi:hypothetical protein